jgi:hypothetical protein
MSLPAYRDKTSPRQYRTTIRVLRKFLIFAALFVPASTLYPASSWQIAQAEAEVARLRQLVQAGAAPRLNLEKAENDLAHLRESQRMEDLLFGAADVQDLTPQQAAALVQIAERQVVEQQHRIEERKRLIEAGVAARISLTPLLEELEHRQKTLDLARSRARLLEQVALQIQAEENLAGADELPDSQPSPLVEKHLGNGDFSTRDYWTLAAAFQRKFGRALPVSAFGSTATHRALGFDHRGRVDVALDPDSAEGAWVLRFLESLRVPYYAFRAAIPGRSTAPHIHLGPPSMRIRRTAD